MLRAASGMCPSRLFESMERLTRSGRSGSSLHIRPRQVPASACQRGARLVAIPIREMVAVSVAEGHITQGGASSGRMEQRGTFFGPCCCNPRGRSLGGYLLS